MILLSLMHKIFLIATAYIIYITFTDKNGMVAKTIRFRKSRRHESTIFQLDHLHSEYKLRLVKFS